jgi:serine/threonine-protein kinase
LRFIEAEINQLLIQILPVLEYIHSLGVLHRDISPDNLILRSSDGMPVLIDFGGVKQVAANVESLFAEANGTPAPATRIGKLGYASVEQMQMGIVVTSAIKSAESFPAFKPEAAARRCFARSLCKAQN